VSHSPRRLRLHSVVSCCSLTKSTLLQPTDEIYRELCCCAAHLPEARGIGNAITLQRVLRWKWSRDSAVHLSAFLPGRPRTTGSHDSRWSSSPTKRRCNRNSASSKLHANSGKSHRHQRDVVAVSRCASHTISGLCESGEHARRSVSLQACVSAWLSALTAPLALGALRIGLASRSSNIPQSARRGGHESANGKPCQTAPAITNNANHLGWVGADHRARADAN
jgi:hypothetical protein